MSIKSYAAVVSFEWGSDDATVVLLDDHVASHAFDIEVERVKFEAVYRDDCNGNIKYHPEIGYYWDTVKYREYAELKQQAWYYWRACAQSRASK